LCPFIFFPFSLFPFFPCTSCPSLLLYMCAPASTPGLAHPSFTHTHLHIQQQQQQQQQHHLVILSTPFLSTSRSLHVMLLLMSSVLV
jgi:hypothetical protein